MAHGWPGHGPVHNGFAAPDLHPLVELAAGVLAGVEGLIGEAASAAMLRHGAFEQGRTLARAAGADLPTALAHVDRLLGQATEGAPVEDGSVMIMCRSSPLLAPQRPLLDAVWLGLHEGLLCGLFGRRYAASLEQRQPVGGGVALFVPEGQ